MLWTTFKQSKRPSYRWRGAVAKQAWEAVREEAESRKDITQTPTLGEHKCKEDGDQNNKYKRTEVKKKGIKKDIIQVLG